MWQRQSERAAAEPYLLTPYGWWLRAQVSHGAPPPLPGGYKAGEKVFYTGPSQTLQPGYDVVHGQQGEVTGPATGEATKGKGVTVLYPGNKGDVACLITLVRRLRVAFAATSRLRPTHATLPKPPARPHPRPYRNLLVPWRSSPQLQA